MALTPDGDAQAIRRRRGARWRLVGITYLACAFMALLLIVEPDATANRTEIWLWVTALFLCTGVILIGATILIAGGPNE